MQSLLEPKQIKSPREERRIAKRRRLRIAEYTLLALGFACLGVYGYTWVESHLYQSYEDYELQCSLEHRQPTLTGYLSSLVSGAAPDKNGEERAYEDLQKPAPGPAPGPGTAPAVPPSGLIGRIEIPRINVSAIVREGVDSSTLRRAAGHVPGTALPGQSGNVAVAAHRDTFFRGLRDITQNDTIRMVTAHGTYDYVVRSTEIVKPSDVQVLDPQHPREMTLITCYPFNYIGHAPKRYIVKAEQIASGPPALFGDKLPPQQANSKPVAAVKRPRGLRRSVSRKHHHFRATMRLARSGRGHKRTSTD